MEVDKMETSTEAEKMETSVEGETMETDEQTAGTSSSKNDKPTYDWTQTIEPHTRIAVIGVDSCGKTALIKAIKGENSVQPGVKYASMRHYLEILVDGETEKCMVEEYDNGEKSVKKRKELHLSQHVALMCYNKGQDHENLEKWKDELEAKGLPVIWVKIKKDQGLDGYQAEVEAEHIICCPPAIKEVKYLFENAVREARRKQSRDKV